MQSIKNALLLLKSYSSDFPDDTAYSSDFQMKIYIALSGESHLEGVIRLKTIDGYIPGQTDPIFLIVKPLEPAG